MCGICGEIRFNQASGASADEFARMIDLVARRGPDDEGYWSDYRTCRLGFRRLAILDLSEAANQPMLAREQRYALVFNGELYNFREIRAELQRLGVDFRTTGDTEVVLESLIRWDIAALDRFNGMFALAFYDAGEQSLLLARDHAGIKPLYMLQTAKGLAFGSQYDQLLAHPWREGLTVSQAALGLYLRMGYIPAPFAILEDTEMLEPGSWLRATSEGRVSRGRYYEFPLYQMTDLHGKAAYEAIDAAVAAAVRRQMVSDVPLGTFLSGGIDSPLVAAKAAAVTSPVKAFTIGVPDSALDESEDARQYATALGLSHTVEFYSPDRALDCLSDVVSACSEPLADMSIFPTMLVSELARREVTVMLSGDGGDELFWGYADRFGSVVRRAGDFAAPYWQRRGRRLAGRILRTGNGDPSLKWATVGDWFRGMHTRLSDSAQRAVFGNFPDWPDNYALFHYADTATERTAQWLRWCEFTGHLSRVLLKVDRASMYNSLEVRVPLLDREVMAVAARVDWRTCLDVPNKTGKLPLRQALVAHTNHQSQGKRGFGVPMDHWLRGPLLPVFRESVMSRDDLLGLAINRVEMERILTDHVAGRVDYSRWLWTVLSLSLWSERYLE